jgi:cardiolipin synthase
MRLRSLPWLAAGLFLASCSSNGGGGEAPFDSGEELDTSIVEDSGVTDVATDTPVPPGTHSTNVTLVVEPDDGEAKILDAIKNATKSIHLEMYLFSDNVARDALIAAKKAGKEVKVLLEKAPYPVTNANVTDYNALLAGGVDVRWTNGTFQLTHSKFFVVDGAAAYVMTLNFTTSGLAGNREYAAIDTDPDDVAQAEAVFGADFSGSAYTPAGGKLMLSPVDARVRLFGAVLARGVKVRIVVPGGGLSTDTNATLLRLKARGAQIKTLSSPSVHAKTIVVDGKLAYVGSINLTTASIDKNREVGLVTETAAVLDRLKSTIDADFAKGAAF